MRIVLYFLFLLSMFSNSFRFSRTDPTFSGSFIVSLGSLTVRLLARAQLAPPPQLVRSRVWLARSSAALFVVVTPFIYIQGFCFRGGGTAGTSRLERLAGSERTICDERRNCLFRQHFYVCACVFYLYCGFLFEKWYREMVLDLVFK